MLRPSNAGQLAARPGNAKNAKTAQKQRDGVLLASLSFAFFASFADKKAARMVAASSMRE
jgi:hypothetical protein